ncbi:aromatic compounds catabolism [Legionella sainthelensi]|uniref:Uncharacterized protein n=1 Tax=Legionella sainthelensi TaxID=28087 RepID=A0A2H5FJW7_9GAMM|nr:DUF4442 domain-containing protein [Legionella sainthelensi]AUH71833.1 DUF4442 domain-containing protein [Legionella sainthelensi]VEB33668.1 aromatic compounds catabolism [Legionella sainthelensi]
MNVLTRFKFFLWRFGHFKVPMIGYLKPRIIKLDDTEIIICLPLNRRSRNHLNSMYFGALSVGADLAGGLHGFYHANQKQCQLSLAFKSFQAHFLRRPESDVYFVCSEGALVETMIQESKTSGERVTKPIHINAFTDYPVFHEKVADFILELSVKVRS